MRSLKWIAAASLVFGCAAPSEQVKVDDSKAKKQDYVSEADGPSPEQQAHLKFTGDRGDQLSFPVFPAGEVRFFEAVEERDRDVEVGAAKKRTPEFCEIDRDCSRDGDRCLKPAGSPGRRGVCGKTKSSAGGTDKASGYVQSCKETWECPDRYDCVLVNGPFGVCVRLSS